MIPRPSPERMSKHLKRAAIAAGGLIVVAAIFAFQTLRASLPQLEGEILSDGLSADVSIERDAAGIPVIRAGNRLDLAYATGFVHAQDRFFQMDLTRRNAAGELAQLFGQAAVEVDRRHRFHRFRARAAEVIRGFTDDDRAFLRAYTAGVNAGLGSLGAKPFEYFLIGQDPKPWVEADSILAVFTMFLELNDERADRDVQRGLAHRVLPRDVFDWLYPDGSEWDAPMLGEPRSVAAIPGPERFSLNGQSVAALKADNIVNSDPVLPGSNNWAIAGALTATGRAIVANDMHLGITTPNVFYRARMQTTGVDAIDLSGVTLPGAPLLVAGSNGHVAWGNTNSYGDWSDAVIVRPGPEPGTYLTPHGPRAFAVHRETIEIAGEAPQSLEIRETIWGPVRDDSPDPEFEIAVNWLAHQAESITLGHRQLETASSVTEALDIANRIGMPPQNFVAGDADGNIGWTIAGQIPRREGYDPLLPADLSNGGGWDGWVAPQDYPRIVNPPSGRIWTANARVVDGDALAIIGDGGYDLGARARQIRDGLAARDHFMPADMLEVQLDDRAVFLERWRQLLLDTLTADSAIETPGRSQYRQLVADWIPRAAPESVGYRLVRGFRAEVRDRVFTMLMQPVYAELGTDTRLRMSNQFENPLWQLVSERPRHLLTDEYSSWGELLLEAIDANIRYYEENFSDGLERRSWGERNTANIRHPMSRAVPFLSRWLDMPREPLAGDSNLPRAQGPSFGASERFAVSPGDEAGGYLHMPAGQSGHPLSDYYRIGHSDWVSGRPSAYLPGAPVHRLVLVAAQ